MRDALLDFGELDLSSSTIDTATAPPLAGRVFPNAIPVDALGDIGKGSPLLIALRVESSVTTATGALAVFQADVCLGNLVASGTYNYPVGNVLAGSPHLGADNNTGAGASEAYCTGLLTAGLEYYFYLPPLPRGWTVRHPSVIGGYLYGQLRSIVAGGAGLTNGGVLSMAIVHGAQLDMDYPSNFTVSNP